MNHASVRVQAAEIINKYLHANGLIGISSEIADSLAAAGLLRQREITVAIHEVERSDLVLLTFAGEGPGIFVIDDKEELVAGRVTLYGHRAGSTTTRGVPIITAPANMLIRKLAE